MASRRGFLAEVQHQQRLAQARANAGARAQTQARAQAVRARAQPERANAAMARVDEAECKRYEREAKAAYVEMRQAEVDELNEDLALEYGEIDGLLALTLDRHLARPRHLRPRCSSNRRHRKVPSARRSFKNGGSVDLDLDNGETRPLGSYEARNEEFVLSVKYPRPPIHSTWKPTTRAHTEVFQGEVMIPVASPVDVTDAARRVLRHQGEEK